jgi:hypothetical protein
MLRKQILGGVIILYVAIKYTVAQKNNLLHRKTQTAA